jgi:hypothetical protein
VFKRDCLKLPLSTFLSIVHIVSSIICLAYSGIVSLVSEDKIGKARGSSAYSRNSISCILYYKSTVREAIVGWVFHLL